MPCSEQYFEFGGSTLKLLAPKPAELRSRFRSGSGEAPYWARIWPACLGLCRFLAAHPERTAGKHVLELAAGLGLPGLVAARYAAQVTISDIDPDAVQVMQASILANDLRNTVARVIDWAAIPEDLHPGLVLLSDVNYDPSQFASLHAALDGLRQQRIPVILSSPQRLLAKPFISALAPWINGQHELQAGGEFISVFEL